MTEFENNDATRRAEEAFSGFDFYNYRDVPGKEYIESLHMVTTFHEYVYQYAKSLGYNGCDQDTLAKFICEKGEKHNNVPLNSLTTVKNWLKKAPPTANKTGRENVYKLCFALKMNADETKEFFLKAYLERPFNYKSINEAVYFFCMNRGLTYSDAVRIIEKIGNPHSDSTKESTKDSRSDVAEEPEVATERVGYDISLLQTEDDIINYISENRVIFSTQNQTASKKINELLEECMKLAQKEHSLLYKDEITVSNIDELLAAITGYYARETQNGEKVFKKTISKSTLPDAIKKNFPQREQFKNIQEGKASFDVIRKALILLEFYHFFASAITQKAEDLEHGLFDEFVDETNELLDKCGYVQLYWRNPYDWIFGYCAWAPNPLDEFKNIIDEFYLSDPQIYTEETL